MAKIKFTDIKDSVVNNKKVKENLNLEIKNVISFNFKS